MDCACVYLEPDVGGCLRCCDCWRVAYLPAEALLRLAIDQDDVEEVA